MNETIKKIGSLIDEVLEIRMDPDGWWEREKKRKEALNELPVCELCEGTGVYYRPNGPDDVDAVECLCQLDPEPDES